jgi:alkaline phosphatase
MGDNMEKAKKMILVLLMLLVISSVSLFSEGIQEQKAKNIIILVGDGMGLGAMELGRIMEYGKDGSLHIQQMKTVGLMTTNPSDGVVTDSAAAGTAMATGIKTFNGGIGVDIDKNPVESMTDHFKKLGKGIGLISTNTVDDATPAAFGAHVADRYAGKSEIVRDYFDSQWDVILGGGTKYFGASKQDGVDMIEKFKDSGYTYVETRDELMNVSGTTKLLGLFTRSYMNYISDREENNSTEPSLVEMTKTALNILSADPDGFFLVSEGARIDHAAHAADATSVWREMIEFDNTVKLCLDWASQNGETLVIVVADHQTMAIAPAEHIDIEALKNISVSAEYMALQLEKNKEETAYTVESIISTFEKYAGLTLSEEDALELQVNMGVDLYPYKLGWEIGSILAKNMGVGVWSRDVRATGGTGGHSAAWVPVFAEGVGSKAFAGSYDNTDLYQLVLDNSK